MKYTLIGKYNGGKILIFEVSTGKYIMCDLESGRVKAESNWVSPLKWVDYFEFVCADPREDKARSFIESHSKELEEAFSRMRPVDKNILKMQGNIKKSVDNGEVPDGKVYW